MNDEQFVELREELNRQSRELKHIRELMVEALFAMRQAEEEIPESMRRFANYFHDIHHIVWTYEERGQQAPRWIKEEMERCDDRLRQLLVKHHTDGGAFDKIRREMASDPLNRWDHTRLIGKPQEQI